MKPVVQWSHSGLKQFKTCPRQFHEVKILKKWPREDTPATLYGTQLHEQAELYIRDQRPLDKEFGFLKPTLDALVQMPGRKFCELEMALTMDLRPCDFKDPNYWVRGIADLVVVDDENFTARVFDYKSGSDRYPDTSQLELMALMIFKHFPLVRRVTGGLLFVLKGTVQKCSVDFDRQDALWSHYREDVARIEAAMENGVWNPQQSGLCKKFCPCLDCPFNGRN
jgi:hypothetical protein